MSQENIDVLRAVYDRWARGDLWTPEVFDPRVEVVWGADMPDVGTYYGLDGLEKGTREFLAAWEQVGMYANEFIERGDTVVVLATARGRGKGSGVEAEAKFAHVWTMRDGKAMRIAAYFDQAEALKASGLEE
jgi:uncharacterized protein